MSFLPTEAGQRWTLWGGERLCDGASAITGSMASATPAPKLVDMSKGDLLGNIRWPMMTDVCQHGAQSDCLEAYPYRSHHSQQVW